MATVKTALKDRLTSFAELSALVGTRIFNMQVPQGTVRPYIMFRRSRTPERLASLQGPSGRARPWFECEIWADSADSMEAVATALRHALDGYRGTVSGVEIGGATLVNEEERFFVEVDLYSTTQVFEVTHRED